MHLMHQPLVDSMEAVAEAKEEAGEQALEELEEATEAMAEEALAARAREAPPASLEKCQESFTQVEEAEVLQVRPQAEKAEAAAGDGEPARTSGHFQEP